MGKDKINWGIQPTGWRKKLTQVFIAHDVRELARRCEGFKLILLRLGHPSVKIVIEIVICDRNCDRTVFMMIRYTEGLGTINAEE